MAVHERLDAKTQKADFPGSALMKLMEQRAKEHELDEQQLADRIEITRPYLRALGRGARPIGGLHREKLRNIANFLGLTLLQTMMLAEIIKPTDLARDRGVVLEQKLERAWQAMRDDPDWGRVAMTPDEWGSLSERARYGVALMWEKISNQELIEKAPLVLVERPEQPPVQAESAPPKTRKSAKTSKTRAV